MSPQGGSGEYTSPFEPFTGYTSKIKPNPTFIVKNEGGVSSEHSQKSPTFITKELEEKLNEKLKKGEAQLKQVINSETLQQRLDRAVGEAKQILDVEDVITSIFLVDDLRVVKY